MLKVMNRSIKNRYIKNAHISEQKFREILKGFAADLTAQSVATLAGVSRNSVNQLYKKFRLRILSMTSEKTENADFSGEIELDESYFGAKRVRGKRGRGAAGKTPVFGVLKRNGDVYVEVIE